MQYIGLDKNATRKDAISDGSGKLPEIRVISGLEGWNFGHGKK